MWLTSNSPAAARVCRCSFRMPVGYCTGIVVAGERDHPPAEAHVQRVKRRLAQLGQGVPSSGHRPPGTLGSGPRHRKQPPTGAIDPGQIRTNMLARTIGGNRRGNELEVVRETRPLRRHRRLRPRHLPAAARLGRLRLLDRDRHRSPASPPASTLILLLFLCVAAARVRPRADRAPLRHRHPQHHPAADRRARAARVDAEGPAAGDRRGAGRAGGEPRDRRGPLPAASAPPAGPARSSRSTRAGGPAADALRGQPDARRSSTCCRPSRWTAAGCCAPLLALRMDRVRATRIAARIGQVLAVGLGAARADRQPVPDPDRRLRLDRRRRRGRRRRGRRRLGRQPAGRAMITDFQTARARTTRWPAPST